MPVLARVMTCTAVEKRANVLHVFFLGIFSIILPFWMETVVLYAAVEAGQRSDPHRTCLKCITHAAAQCACCQVDVINFSEDKVTPVVEAYGGVKLRMEVVPIESAYPGFGDLIVLKGTDHVNACKPLNRQDVAYTKTLEFLRKLEGASKERKQDGA